VQCSGSTCYCSDPLGVKINGTETPIEDFNLMHCGCATDAHAFKKTKRVGLKFKCDSMGNYESIQCRGSVCYCADLFGYQINETSRHISQYSNMTCPEAMSLPDEQPCKEKILRKLKRPSGQGAILHSCDDYGYFEPVQMRGSMLLCVSSDGTYLGYPTKAGDSAASRKNCLCAVDMYEKNPRRYVAVSSKCDRLGNYKPRQCRGFECYCVDSEGNRVRNTNC